MKIFKGQVYAPNGNNPLTAVNGGGEPAGGAGVALCTDRTVAGDWEKYKLILSPGSTLGTNMRFALQTSGGEYLTAVNGGGVGGPNDDTCPIHSDATLQWWRDQRQRPGDTHRCDDNRGMGAVLL